MANGFAQVANTIINSSIGSCEPGTYGKLPVHVTILVIRDHGRIAAQPGHNGRLLGNEIEFNESHAARRLKHPVQPLRQSWEKHLVLGGRLVASGDGPKRK